MFGIGHMHSLELTNREPKLVNILIDRHGNATIVDLYLGSIFWQQFSPKTDPVHAMYLEGIVLFLFLGMLRVLGLCDARAYTAPEIQLEVTMRSLICHI